jgi:hypothetical protein
MDMTGEDLLGKFIRQGLGLALEFTGTAVRLQDY